MCTSNVIDPVRTRGLSKSGTVSLRPWLILLAVVLYPNGNPIHGQESALAAETDTLLAVSEHKKLGPRLAVGGFYGLFSASFRESRHRSIYGPQIAILIPVGSQCDIALSGSYLYVPGISYTRPLTSLEELNRRAYIALSAPNTPLPPTERTFTILPSRIVAFQTGVRIYARMMRPDALVSAMSPKFQRPFWRKRVDRRGFHVGIYTGPVVGWHKRTIRALPESWPVNEPIPESAVEKTEEIYQRYYWSGTFELGWTFNGRVDLALSYGDVVRFQGEVDSPAEQAADAFDQTRVMGSLSIILGHTRLQQP